MDENRVQDLNAIKPLHKFTGYVPMENELTFPDVMIYDSE